MSVGNDKTTPQNETTRHDTKQTKASETYFFLNSVCNESSHYPAFEISNSVAINLNHEGKTV